MMNAPENKTAMLAATIVGPRRVELQRVVIPGPGATQVRVRLEGCGVGASNLPVWEGEPGIAYPLPPGAPGHEGWGRVDAVGEAVSGVAVGDRVAILSGNAFAEYDIAPATSLVKIPDDGGHFPCEPVGCAMNILRRAGVQENETIAIVGIGFLGALLTRLATAAGARVIAISRRPYSLEVATRMGACMALSLEGAVVDEIRAATCGRLCDVVIEATGKQRPLDLAAQLTRGRGRLVIVGYHRSGPRQVNLQLWNGRGLDVINAHERDTAIYVGGMSRALEAVREGTLEITPLCTHTFPLARLGEALEMAACRPPGFIKALVAC